MNALIRWSIRYRGFVALLAVVAILRPVSALGFLAITLGWISVSVIQRVRDGTANTEAAFEPQLEAAQMLAATAAPDPELEPEGLRSRQYGLRVCPPRPLHPLVE